MKGTSIHTRYLGQHIEPEAAAGPAAASEPVRKAVTSCVREHGVVFLTASFEDSDSTASSMFFEDIFPAFFQYASGEDCFESDEYIHEALFEIGRITNIQHKKAFV